MQKGGQLINEWVCYLQAISPFRFFSTKQRDWLGRTSAKWPVLCRVGQCVIQQCVIRQWVIQQSIFKLSCRPSRLHSR